VFFGLELGEHTRKTFLVAVLDTSGIFLAIDDNEDT
jgi:hypothetical protein